MGQERMKHGWNSSGHIRRYIFCKVKEERYTICLLKSDPSLALDLQNVPSIFETQLCGRELSSSVTASAAGAASVQFSILSSDVSSNIRKELLHINKSERPSLSRSRTKSIIHNVIWGRHRKSAPYSHKTYYWVLVGARRLTQHSR